MRDSITLNGTWASVNVRSKVSRKPLTVRLVARRRRPTSPTGDHYAEYCVALDIETTVDHDFGGAGPDDSGSLSISPLGGPPPAAFGYSVDIPAGVAVGSGVPLMAGAQAEATILLDLRVAGLPEGLHQGSIMVEALLPNGVVDAVEITVVVDKQGVARYEAGTPLS